MDLQRAPICAQPR
jgi:hypothetical protein